MFLFIFESLGTSELILIGIVALIFLGPRKLPLMARKIGKIMAEFRSTAGEFRETWAREVNFEEEVKSLQLSDLEAEDSMRTAAVEGSAEPKVHEVDPGQFKDLRESVDRTSPNQDIQASPENGQSENERANWL